MRARCFLVSPLLGAYYPPEIISDRGGGRAVEGGASRTSLISRTTRRVRARYRIQLRMLPSALRLLPTLRCSAHKIEQDSAHDGYLLSQGDNSTLKKIKFLHFLLLLPKNRPISMKLVQLPFFPSTLFVL